MVETTLSLNGLEELAIATTSMARAVSFIETFARNRWSR